MSHLVVLYLDYSFSASVVCVSTDGLKTRDSALKCYLAELPHQNFPEASSTFCVPGDEGPKLYVFGGLSKRPDSEDSIFLRKALYYTLPRPTLPAAKPRPVLRTPMDNTHMFESLVAQVGDDGDLYFLGFAFDDEVLKNVDTQHSELVVNKYNYKSDNWTIVSRVVNSLFGSVKFLRYNISKAPHVVIGNKLHVSFGERSFAFDTVEAVWEESQLFNSFWSSQNKLSPSKLLGGKFWGVDEYVERNLYSGGKPFGFRRRGIIWDNDILLGVLDSPRYALIAYLLRDGVVVKYQTFSYRQLSIKGRYLIKFQGSLVGLGGDHFGLLHFHYEGFEQGSKLLTKLVTFKVSRPEPTAPKDQLLKCEFVRGEIVARDLLPDSYHTYYTFVV